MKARILFAVCFLAIFALAQMPSPASAQMRIRLTRIHCNDAQEEGLFSDGDEPYVLTAVIAPGGPLGRRLLFNLTDDYDDFDDGDNRSPNLTLFNEIPTGSVVVVAQAVEHDDSEIELIVGAAQIAAQNAFANALLNGITDTWTLGQIVGAAMHDGVVAAALPFVDDDDVIGSPAMFTFSRATYDGMPVNGFFNLHRQVAGGGATYTLTFEGRRIF